MPDIYKIKKGLDIKLLGEAERNVSDILTEDIALKPPDFISVFPKLFVKEGDKVKVGTPVFFDKYRNNISFTSPVSGTVTEIRRGAKRVMLEVRIKSDKQMEYKKFLQADPSGLSREQIVEQLLKSGLWPHIRQRPYSVIADPQDNPKAIFISTFDSAPLAPDYSFILQDEKADFQNGINALSKLTSGKIHLGVTGDNSASDTFLQVQNADVHKFSGPHPAGNVGTQIHSIDPVNKGDIVWYLNPCAVVTIGKLFKDGKVDPYRKITVTGSEFQKPAYFKVLSGATVQDILRDNLKTGKSRIISGNVLTGKRIDKIGYLGFYDYQITAIPEGDKFEFLGWAAVGLKKFSFSKSYFSWLTPSKKYRLNTNLNGGNRAFVLTGEFEKVFPMDIYPLQLIKAIIIEDIDLMEQLGIYEVDEEDFALCEFIDTSKTEIQSIVRKGLNLMRKEMT
ncbi:MAG: Na(+)-translocating NADH-quinone reductase subunit A [Bacteroidales bacterium]|nr:Na(+)-translocating NADH-quinone reductase subunit A [Bacteroidales bacterium]